MLPIVDSTGADVTAGAIASRTTLAYSSAMAAFMVDGIAAAKFDEAEQAIATNTAALVDASKAYDFGFGGNRFNGYPVATPPTSVAENITQVYRNESSDGIVRPASASIHFASYDTWGRVRTKYDYAQAWLEGGKTADGISWQAEIFQSGRTASAAEIAAGEIERQACNPAGPGGCGAWGLFGAREREPGDSCV